MVVANGFEGATSPVHCSPESLSSANWYGNDATRSKVVPATYQASHPTCKLLPNSTYSPGLIGLPAGAPVDVRSAGSEAS